MSDHPDQENRNIREIEARYDDRSDNETPAETEAREEREARQSDTPRTDACQISNPSFLGWISADFARTLERELAAVTAERDKATQLAASYESLSEECGTEFEGVDEIKDVIRLLKEERAEQQREIARLKEELVDAEQQAERERRQRQLEVGAQEYRGNTVSYIYDKCANYGRQAGEIIAARNAAVADRDSLAAKLAEKTAQLEAACKQLESLAEDVESVTVEHAACEAKLTEAHERISWLEQQREVECQQKEAALAESSESLRETEATKANFVEAQKDTERLDWLRVYIKSCFLIGLQDQAIQILLGDDVRADIDAAKEQP